jgi:hypothetical protein
MKWKFIRPLIGSLALMSLVSIGSATAALGATFSARPVPIFAAGQFVMLPNQRLLSQNGQYWLTLQSAGNVVIYNVFHPLFGTNTVGKTVTQLVFQSDGNLVLYNGTTPLWASNTAGNPAATLHLQDDGNLVIYSAAGVGIWSTATSSGSGLLGNVNKIVSGSVTSSKIVVPNFATPDVVIADYDAVAQYSADPTGSVDSTASIQNALNTCSADGGGTVWLQAGSYKVSSTIAIPAFCTLRGDWQHLTGSPSGETIIVAKVTSGASGPSVFSIGGSAALMGVVIYYPDQTLSSVVPYGYSIVVPSGGHDEINSSIINVTLLNSYAGISISSNSTIPHEVATVLNVEGTVLSVGLHSANSSDFDIYENINFGPQFWSLAGADYNAPPVAATLAAYTKANAFAFQLGDLEWSQFLNLSATSFFVGVETFLGTRTHFSGEFVNVQLSDCVYGIYAADIYHFWNKGAAFVGGSISAAIAVENLSSSGNVVTLNHTALSGALAGNVVVTNQPAGTQSATIVPPVFQEPLASSVPKTTSTRLYDVSQSPYSVLRVQSNLNGLIPFYDMDVTAGIQQALNDAGANGGGVVYLPAGWYYLGGSLTVPANVELRGASSAPARDQLNLSGGTVLFTTVGRNSATVSTDPAFITLNGNFAGVSGFVIFYPSNNPAYSLTETYPYAIRGSGSSTYVKNVAFSNGYFGVDFMTHSNPGHWIERVDGLANANLISAGNGGGTIRNITSNPNSPFRSGYFMQHWATSETSLISANQSRLQLIELGGSTDASLEQLVNISSYGAAFGILNFKQSVNVFNLATDGLGADTVYASQPISIQNILRFSGAGSTLGVAPAGSITLWNDDDLIN